MNGEKPRPSAIIRSVLSFVVSIGGAAEDAPERDPFPLVGIGLMTGAGMVGTAKRRKAQQTV